MREVVFRYTPRPWQRDAGRLMAACRNVVIVAHRRAGKTEAVAVRLILAALSLTRKHPSPFFGYVAPFLNQAKAVAWDRLKFYARQIPFVRVNEQELSIQFPNLSTVRIFGADYPDRLRGLGFDGIVMDEVAQMRPETWPEVVRPALADRQGWAVFIGTPKGQNVFYDLAERARREEGWGYGEFRADQTGVLPDEELARTRQEMGDNIFAQEFLCDFTAANTDSFIDFAAVQAATRPLDMAVNPAPLVLGLDPARFGDDRTVLVHRRGPAVEKVSAWRGLDLMQTASRVAEIALADRPQALFVDAVGLGAGVVDRLRQLGHRVIAVNSGARPEDPGRYFNLKAEMWARVRDWLIEGGRIPDDQALRADLLAPRYEYDAAGRLKIESKDDLKARGLSSPDCADALALTFAQPVAAADVAGLRPRRATQTVNTFL